MKQVYTYFWQRLPIGALISVATISVASSKSALQWCNFLKSSKKSSPQLMLHSNTVTLSETETQLVFRNEFVLRILKLDYPNKTQKILTI